MLPPQTYSRSWPKQRFGTRAQYQALAHVCDAATMCDTHLRAHFNRTHRFTHTCYDRRVSAGVQLQDCDVGCPIDDCNRNIGGKSYASQFTWGQLTYWDRQSIADPSASLAAARYGTVCLPDIDSCYAKGAVYNAHHRQRMIYHLEHRPGSQWLSSWHWRFSNKLKIFGTPWLDEIILGSRPRKEPTTSTSALGAQQFVKVGSRIG